MSIKRVGFIVAVFLVLGSGMAYANDTTPQPDHNSDDFTFVLTGNGACQSDGSYLITWTISNVSTAPYTNSNPVMSYAGGTVPALGTATFTQIIDGTKPSVTTQSITGSWNTDTDDNRTETATVTLSAPCVQPVPQNIKPTVTTQTVLGAQTVTPIVVQQVPGFSGK